MILEMQDDLANEQTQQHCRPGGNCRVTLNIKHFAPHKPRRRLRHVCPKKLVETRCKEDDMLLQNWAKIVLCNVFDTAETMTDTSGGSHSVSVNSAATVPTIRAGLSGTTPTAADTVLGTPEESAAATMSAVSGSGSSCSFTGQATITATALRAYQECGFEITVGGNIYLIAHDVFSTLNVSNGGTLQVTYTFTWS
jgi:hypothetical protein